MEFPVLRKRRLEVRPLRIKETHHNIYLVNKPGFHDDLSTCCHRITYQELNVMLKGSMSVSDKVGCFPLAICF